LRLRRAAGPNHLQAAAYRREFSGDGKPSLIEWHLNAMAFAGAIVRP
jgi:hypothetical protein